MRRYVLLIVAFAAAAGCIRLGVWQLARLAERRDRNRSLEAHLQLPPLDSSVATVSDSLHFRRITVAGVFDLDRQIVVMGRSLNGVPGVHVVTPLRLGSGAAVLVERWWVASPDGKTVDLDGLDEPDTTTVTGVVLVQPAGRVRTSGEWPLFVTGLNAEELAARYPYPLRPMVIRRTDEVAVSAIQRPVPLPALSGGPHLSYAIQWFSFAAIAVIGSLILFWRLGRPDLDRDRGQEHTRS